MKKIIVASNNQKKIKEIKEILNELDIEVKSLKDENINIEVEEDEITFEGNSRKKAVEIKDYLLGKGEKNFLVMADDSGLEVDYLNGEPGVLSARYSGEHGNDEANNEKLLKNLKDVPLEKRTARFVCAITVVNEKGELSSVRGEAEGIITEEIKGDGGFGYDPLFYVQEFEKTFSEITAEEKNKISHRGKALMKIKDEINKLK
ncbi:MAG: XTP/dITP diphosphatase [Sarcina sp.]